MEESELQRYQPNHRLLCQTMRRPVASEALSILDSIAERLYERLSLLQQSPTKIIDLGTGDGRHLKWLQQRYKDARIVGADLSHERLRSATVRRRFWHKRPLTVCLDAAQPLPFGTDCFDLVISNMMLPWIFDARPLMAEINRVMAKEGAFFISTAGPDTLRELRDAWQAIDNSVHVNAFMDMHDVGDLLIGAGIADPVLDTERVTVHYSSIEALLKEMTGLGFINVLSGRRRGLTSADVISRLAQHYPCNEQGGIEVTLELVVAHGWAGQPRSKQTNASGEFIIPLDQLRKGV